MKYRDFTLYPFQEDAIRAIEADRSVLVSAPTGAGKTVIAEYAIERCLEQGRRIVYTSPIKALSNQKYRDFRRQYGERIGIMTGDVTIDPEAPVQIMTTEIFRNTLFEDADRVRDVAWVVMDEIHYISDADRGTVWEETLMFAPKTTHFVGLSATISNLEQFREWLEQVREEAVIRVHTDDRPVPLDHSVFVPDHGEARIGELKKLLAHPPRRGRRGRQQGPGIIAHLARGDLLPALFFCFSRRECEARARRTSRRSFLDREQSRRVVAEFDEMCARYEIEEHGAAVPLREMLAGGVSYHHAGMLPVYKEIIERLFTTGLIKLLYTTETFALGVNMPARSVVFASLRKFDGVSFDYIPTLNYYQMAGRAGRQGLDSEGHVISMIDPEFDTQKAVKTVVFGKVAPLQSRFNLSYSATLNLYGLLGKDIFTAVDRSFAAFQRGGSSQRDRALLKRRLNVLESRGYIRGGELTGKGRFASRINAYEIQVTELFWGGCFESLGAIECAMLVGSVVYEARRSDFGDNVQVQGFGSLRNRARKLINEFRRVEHKAGLEDGIKVPDFGLSGAIKAWCGGCHFEELQDVTGSQDGDLVRNLRMTIQVLRQFAWAARDDEELHHRLQDALHLLNRDEVDAERQLRLG